MLVVGGKACLSQVVKSQTPMGSDGMEDERRREATSWSTPVPVWQLRRPAATTNLAKYLVHCLWTSLVARQLRERA